MDAGNARPSRAYDIYRRLATARPDAFEPGLAASLTNLGPTLSHLGRREEALDASAEAVDIYRRLATAHPDAFEPNLARSLWGSAWVRVALQDASGRGARARPRGCRPV